MFWRLCCCFICSLTHVCMSLVSTDEFSLVSASWDDEHWVCIHSVCSESNGSCPIRAFLLRCYLRFNFFDIFQCLRDCLSCVDVTSFSFPSVGAYSSASDMAKFIQFCLTGSPIGMVCHMYFSFLWTLWKSNGFVVFFIDSPWGILTNGCYPRWIFLMDWLRLALADGESFPLISFFLLV